jgi:hypothetical protein
MFLVEVELIGSCCAGMGGGERKTEQNIGRVMVVV